LAQADEPSLIGRLFFSAVVVSAASAPPPEPAVKGPNDLSLVVDRSELLRWLARTQWLAQSHTTALGGIVGLVHRSDAGVA
jgi:hypothetical protein